MWLRILTLLASSWPMPASKKRADRFGRHTAPAVLTMCCAALTGLAPVAASAQIFVGASEQSGAIVLSTFSSGEANVLLIPASLAPAPRTPEVGTQAARGRRPVSAELHRIVESAALRSAISPRLIHAVIQAESQYMTMAVSNRGAIGLMQLLPSTARRFGADNPFDPAQNVSAGAAYLKWLMDFFGDDLELALAGYNAGEQAVVRAGRKVPPYAETQAYVKRVLASLAPA